MFYATIISPKSGGVNRLIASPYDLLLAERAGIADIFGNLTRTGRLAHAKRYLMFHV
jgi:hypothetical protein